MSDPPRYNPKPITHYVITSEGLGGPGAWVQKGKIYKGQITKKWKGKQSEI